MSASNIFSENNSPIKITAKIIFTTLILLAFSVLVYALSFSSSPEINSGDQVYTLDDVYCVWGASGDTTSANVSWYKNGVYQFGQAGVTSPAILGYGNTTKGETWICQVTLLNATDNLTENASATIVNSAPINVEINNGTHTFSNLDSIVEDTEYTFFIHATDPDGDDIQLYEVSLGDGLCTDEDTSSPDSGEIFCIPAHRHLTGSPANGVEPSSSIIQIRLSADDGEKGSFVRFNFTILPVNDQATFAQNVSGAIATADVPWAYVINGTDEEFDLNYSFSMYSLLNETLMIQQINGSSINLTFNLTNNAPTNAQVGNWTVYLNITDFDGSNATRPPTQMSFDIQVISVNHPPEFITNFTNLTIIGTQGNYFELFFYGNDSDLGDVLNFSVTKPTGQPENCSGVFPWNVTTLDTNGTNASGIINASLNNSHIDCRYVQINIFDQVGGSSSEVVFFNLTNVNDPPIIEIMSENGNISNQTGRLNVYFSYQVNVTDIDEFTYDAVNTANLTYTINDTNFNISSTGEIYFYTSNESMIGNWTVLVTVNDSQAIDTELFYIEIFNNSAPILSVPNNNITVYQNDSILINFSGLEPDNDSMSVEIKSFTLFNQNIYGVELENQSFLGGQNTINWFINLTGNNSYYANSLVGEHYFLINISDNNSASIENLSTTYMNVTILNVNDAPFFDVNENNESDNNSVLESVFGSIQVGDFISLNFKVTDFDLFLSDDYLENLSFNYSNESLDLQNISFVKTSNTSALLQFVSIANTTQSITLKVQDLQGAYDERTIYFNVSTRTQDPVVEQIKPYFNTTTNLTVYDFISASVYPNANTSINLSENTTVVFDAIITIDTDNGTNNNSLNMFWYVDDVLELTKINVTSGVDSNFTYYFNFFSNGTHNITLMAQDNFIHSKNWTWVVNISNVNRPPLYLGNLSDFTFNISITQTDYFSYGNGVQKFYDPDSNPLDTGETVLNLSTVVDSSTELTFSENASCSFITFGYSNDSLIVHASETGVCFVTFTGTDVHGDFVTSDQVMITAEGADPQAGAKVNSNNIGGSTTKTKIVTVPYEEEVEVPAPVNIIAPESVDIYENKTLYIPIILENTWESELRGVSLNASLLGDVNATYSFSVPYFPSIPQAAKMETTLEISNYREGGPFEIVVQAKVGDPEFTDSVKILINSLEQSSEGDAVKTKVTFAKDMLSENPECRELNDLLDRADRAVDALDYKEAINLVNSVINGCKFLMNKEEIIRRETPSLIKTSFDFIGENADKIAMGAGIITFLTIIAYAIVGVRKLLESRNS